MKRLLLALLLAMVAVVCVATYAATRSASAKTAPVEGITVNPAFDCYDFCMDVHWNTYRDCVNGGQTNCTKRAYDAYCNCRALMCPSQGSCSGSGPVKPAEP